jgi:hypothetical protein
MNNYTSPSSPQKKNNKKIWTHKSHNIRIPWHSANPPSQIMVINQQVNCIWYLIRMSALCCIELLLP